MRQLGCDCAPYQVLNHEVLRSHLQAEENALLVTDLRMTNIVWVKNRFSKTDRYPK
jgi:hypothetical protein